MEGVCKYFQCGFCKFGEHCRKKHVKEICPIQSCTLISCTKRHPKVCRYFLVHNSCKFGDQCSYKHINQSTRNNIDELKEKIVVLEGSIQSMAAKILELIEEVTNIKRDIPEKHEEIIHSCSQCSYTASTNTVLKRHITMKHKSPKHLQKIFCDKCGLKFPSNSDLEEHNIVEHKPETPLIEKERYEVLNNSLELTPNKEERSDDCSDSSPSHINTLFPTADPLPSSPAPSIIKNKCGSNQCTNVAANFFPTTNIFKIKYNNIFVCDPCTRFIPLKELRKNPPLKV